MGTAPGLPLITAGIIGMFGGIITFDCCQRNYCLGGVRDQYWMGTNVGNEESGVKQFAMGNASMVSFFTSCLAFLVGLNSLKNFRRIREDDRSRKAAADAGREEGDLVFEKNVLFLDKEESDGFI